MQEAWPASRLSFLRKSPYDPWFIAEKSIYDIKSVSMSSQDKNIVKLMHTGSFVYAASSNFGELSRD